MTDKQLDFAFISPASLTLLLQECKGCKAANKETTAAFVCSDGLLHHGVVRSRAFVSIAKWSLSR
jgi:hypothetical protein